MTILTNARFDLEAAQFASACAILVGAKANLGFKDGHYDIVADGWKIEDQEKMKRLTITQPEFTMETALDIQEDHITAYEPMGYDKGWTAVLTTIAEEFGGFLTYDNQTFRIERRPLREDCEENDAIFERIAELRQQPALIHDPETERVFVVCDRVRHVENNHRKGLVGTIYSLYGGSPRIGYPNGGTGSPNSLAEIEIIG